MATWEYLVAVVDLASGDRPCIRWLNGEEVPNWKQTPYHVHLNQLGALGWELVTLNLIGTRHQSFVFKRPKSD